MATSARPELDFRAAYLQGKHALFWRSYCRIHTVNGRYFIRNNGNASVLSHYSIFALREAEPYPPDVFVLSWSRRVDSRRCRRPCTDRRRDSARVTTYVTLAMAQPPECKPLRMAASGVEPAGKSRKPIDRLPSRLKRVCGYPGNETAGPPSTLRSVEKHFQEMTAEPQISPLRSP